MENNTHLVVLFLIILTCLVGILASCSHIPFSIPARTMQRDHQVDQWLANPNQHAEWAVSEKTRCGNAPFIIPTHGFIGYIWDDSFRIGHRHQGIDIFGGGNPGEIPVYAAVAGYLTRMDDWKSSVIIRIPQDPFDPSRQIWTYYTHMADSSGNTSFIDPAFPPGTKEVYIPAGTLIGYQGNYSGSPDTPVGVHLHFSIVKDENGRFKNELKIENTLDPSLYFGIPLNANTNQGKPTQCK